MQCVSQASLHFDCCFKYAVYFELKSWFDKGSSGVKEVAWEGNV